MVSNFLLLFVLFFRNSIVIGWMCIMYFGMKGECVMINVLSGLLLGDSVWGMKL